MILQISSTNRNNIANNLHIYFLCLVLFFIEEKTFYVFFQDYATVVAMIASASFAVFALLYLAVYERPFLKVDPLPIVIYSMAIFIVCFSVFIRALFFPEFGTDIVDILRIITYLFVFSVILFCMTKEDTLTALNFLNKLILIAAVINIPIVIFDKFLLWEKWWMRSGSIFFHPNSGGALLGFSLVFTLLNKESFKSSLVRYTAIFLFLFGLVFSFSRGSAIATVFALLALGFCKKTKSTIFITSFLVLIGVFAINPIANFIENYFPLYHLGTGWAERDTMWLSAFEWIKQNPFLGLSQDNLRGMIASITEKGYQSSHNAFVDSALLFGLPFVFLIFVLYVFSISKSIKENCMIFCLLIYYIVNSNTLSSSVGFSPLIVGTLGIHPFILTLLALYPYQQSTKKSELKNVDK